MFSEDGHACGRFDSCRPHMDRSKITEAPWDDKGNLLHFPDNWLIRQVIWKPIESFKATLVLVGRFRGNSAAYFIWEDENGCRYPMFMFDIDELIMNTTIDHGTVSGTWIPKRRGQNFGIRYLG